MQTITPDFNVWQKLEDGADALVLVQKDHFDEVVYKKSNSPPSPSTTGRKIDQVRSYESIFIAAGESLWVKSLSQNQVLTWFVDSSSGTGLTPAQSQKLDKSAKYQSEFTATVVFEVGEVVSSQGALWEKLTASPASTTLPYSDPTNWQWRSGEVSVVAVPPQGTVTSNSPEFIFDTVNTKRYRLDTTPTNPIYVPADGSTSSGGGGSSSNPVYPDGTKINY